MSGGVRLSGLVCVLSPFICLPSCVCVSGGVCLAGLVCALSPFMCLPSCVSLSGGVCLAGLVCALSPFICLPSCVSLSGGVRLAGLVCALVSLHVSPWVVVSASPVLSVPCLPSFVSHHVSPWVVVSASPVLSVPCLSANAIGAMPFDSHRGDVTKIWAACMSFAREEWNERFFLTTTTKTTLNYTTATTPLHYDYNYNCSTPQYIQQLWVRWLLQPLHPLQKTQLQLPFGPSVDSLCHPWFTTSNRSHRFLFLKLLPAPCAVPLGIYLEILEGKKGPSCPKKKMQFK